MSALRIILGDQLSLNISSLRDVDLKKDLILMCELKQEATYVKHHKKKIAFLFSAMRHFAKTLREKNFQLHYTEYNDPQNTGSFTEEIQRLLKNHDFKKIIITEPGEHRVLRGIQRWSQDLKLPVVIYPDDRFLCSTEDFSAWAKDRKQCRMEFFYRHMRKLHNILMDGDKPIGGKWNYDIENRKPAKNDLVIPKPYSSTPDKITKAVLELVETEFANHFGDLKPFHFAVTRAQARQALKHFIKHALPNFGDYQDAMVEGEPWMYHSHLSFYLNCGLLTPMECIKAAEDAFYNEQAAINAVEGFIRQILGWREYVRGVYWLKMPNYAKENFFSADRTLPDFYWTGNTKMNCLKQCVTETKKNAYAHHIQRLMVLGNFALLAGIDPKEVNEWFLIVYADAYEWVELPNVTGMILFADGGYLASKPYAAGGAYINKMSNYCKSCAYKVSKKNGEDACPFNYLYWDFLARNQVQLKTNHRLGMMYKTYERMSAEKKEAITTDSKQFLKTL